MTCKDTRKVHILRVIAQLFGVLIILIALAAVPQTRGQGLPSGRLSVAPSSPNANAPLLAQELLRGRSSAEGSSANRSESSRLVAPMAPAPPFFSQPVIYASGGTNVTYSVAVGDVNGDGKLDLVVANGDQQDNSDGSVGVLLGNGDGTFRPVVTYDSGATFSDFVVMADVNGDGKPDIVVANTGGGDNGDGSVSVLLGNGDGTLRPAVTYDSGGQGPDSVAVGDVNLDGKPDLLVANGCFGINCASGPWVGVLLGNGDGTFQPAVIYDNGGLIPKAVAAADVNGDGKPDMLVANLYSFSLDPKAVGVRLGNGDGTFQSEVFYGVSSGNGASSIEAADVNLDGELDILFVNDTDSNGGVGVLLGNGDGTFQPVTTYASGGSETGGPGLAVADVNGDGKPDLLVANYAGYCVPDCGGAVDLLLGNGDGTFQAAASYSSGGYGAQSVAVADLNGNGKPDAAVAHNSLSAFGGPGPVGVLLNADATKTTLVSAPNPSIFGQAVTFTAKVKSGGGIPKGTVLFFEGSTELGSATLANGKGSIAISSLLVGPHSITAAYQGGSGFAPSASTPLSQVVDIASTTTSLASSQNPAVITELVTYTATVGSQYGGAVTGTVMFQDGGSTVATVTMVGNQAAYSTKYSTPGTHSITATYSGDTNNTGSVSPALVEQINKGFPSKTVLTTSGSPSFVGQPVTFTATVSSTHGSIPDGELVTFYDGTTAIGTGGTSSGVATFSTSSLTAKTHTIKATYGGDANFRPSTGAVTQVVNGYPTTTTLTSSPNPSNSGQKVTFTATVTSSGPMPTGTVKFMDGTTKLGAAILSGGVAKLTKSTLAVGTHPITAQYMGDAFSAKSTSAVVNQVVQ
jgi:hypothetical protein